MKFIRKDVNTKEVGLVKVYIPIEIPNQLRFMDALTYNRIILSNADGFSFLRDIFLIAGGIDIKQSIIYIPNKSRKEERYQEWFEFATFNMDMVICNYHLFKGKQKMIKRVIDISKKINGSIENLESKLDISKNVPHWKLEKKLCFKTYSKYLIVSTNQDGFIELAKEADGFKSYKDEETYYCDGHVHIGNFDEHDKIGTDFWYYYQNCEK